MTKFNVGDRVKKVGGEYELEGTVVAAFNTLSGTPLARLRHKDKWLEYAQQITSGQSLRTSAKVCNMHRNTAFR